MATNRLFKNLLQRSLIAAGLVACAAPAQAAGFTQFTFGTHTNYNNDPTADIMLESVTMGDKSISTFKLVNDALIKSNIDASSTQLGAGSTDAGDSASNVASIVNENPNEADIVNALGNLNLNNIIDTEDKGGESIFDVTFDGPVNTFFFFERGLNSDLLVQALDALNQPVGEKFRINRNMWVDADYDIDTTEIAQRQDVGSYGLKFNRDIAGLRISSFGASYNGPDYKVVAAKTPEPGSMAALGIVAGSMLLAQQRRRKRA